MSVFTLVDGLLSDAVVTRGYTRPVVSMLEQEVLAMPPVSPSPRSRIMILGLVPFLPPTASLYRQEKEPF